MKVLENVVDLSVTATRLPLSMVERVRGEEVRATWPPVRVVNAVDAFVLDTAGQLLGSERLVARARLLRQSVERAGEADRLAREAEQTRTEAEQRFAARRTAAERADDAAAERAEDQREEVQEAAEAEVREARRRAAKRTKAQREADERRRRRVAATERDADRTRIAAEREALAEERAAVAAESKALRLDDAVEATKERRRAEKRQAG